MDLNVKGFLLKDGAVREIVECIRSVVAGKHYISPSISEYLINRSERSREFRRVFPSLDQLTPTERTILRRIADGKTSREIADELHVSSKTIDNHRLNISTKLDIHGSHKLLKFAVQNKSKL